MTATLTKTRRSVTGKWAWQEYVLRDWEPDEIPAGLRLSTAILLACFLAVQYGQDGKYIYPAADKVAARFGMSETTVKRYRTWLIKAGLFRIVRMRGKVPELEIAYPDSREVWIVSSRYDASYSHDTQTQYKNTTNEDDVSSHDDTIQGSVDPRSTPPYDYYDPKIEDLSSPAQGNKENHDDHGQLEGGAAHAAHLRGEKDPALRMMANRDCGACREAHLADREKRAAKAGKGRAAAYTASWG